MRASKANPAYPHSPVTSQAPDPILEATPIYHELTATSQARSHPKASSTNPNSSATFQAPNTPYVPSPEPSHEPFEPHLDQVRRDGVTRSRHHP